MVNEEFTPAAEMNTKFAAAPEARPLYLDDTQAIGAELRRRRSAACSTAASGARCPMPADRSAEGWGGGPGRPPVRDLLLDLARLSLGVPGLWAAVLMGLVLLAVHLWQWATA